MAVDDAGDAVNVDADDVTWTAATGNPTGTLLICYDGDTGVDTDANLIPLVALHFATTPDGTGITARPGLLAPPTTDALCAVCPVVARFSLAPSDRLSADGDQMTACGPGLSEVLSMSDRTIGRRSFLAAAAAIPLLTSGEALAHHRDWHVRDKDNDATPAEPAPALDDSYSEVYP